MKILILLMKRKKIGNKKTKTINFKIKKISYLNEKQLSTTSNLNNKYNENVEKKNK